MKIKILGTGCAKCANLTRLTQEVADKLALDYTLEKVTDLEKIMEYSVMSTPALVIAEEVVHSGSVPSASVLTEYLSR